MSFPIIKRMDWNQAKSLKS